MTTTSPVPAIAARPVVEELNDSLSSVMAIYRVWCQRAESFAQQGFYKASLASFDAALKIQASDYKVWVFRSIVLSQLQHPEAAVASMNRALDLVSDPQEVWHFCQITHATLKTSLA